MGAVFAIAGYRPGARRCAKTDAERYQRKKSQHKLYFFHLDHLLEITVSSMTAEYFTKKPCHGFQ
jgi:hypothetical protein